ncbi:MAG: NADH-quinone oxidoreductase subunit N [candidate division Zixibacteria bacterium]|nr:NADH-quinone oxidoreductase subunit N [candidate division Zixibacteria bacterium]
MYFIPIFPEIFLFLWAILIFVVDFFLKEDKRKNLGYLSLLGILITIILLFFSAQGEMFGKVYSYDSLSLFFKLVFLLSAFLAISVSIDFVAKFRAFKGEFFGLILFSTVGMMLLSSARELIFLYVSLELVTIPLYVLAAYLKPDKKSAEAGLKYMLLGAISSAILLYGISLIYGITGTTFLLGIKTRLMVDYLQIGPIGPGLFLSFIFFIAGFGFKLALVPFHMWAPDVYEGAPTPITAFLSVGSKAAGLVAFLRVFFESFSVYNPDWVTIVAVLAALSMIIGNIIALPQTNIKRMLAYSSIAQVGYILVGLVALSERGVSSVAFYTLAYLFANLGAFVVAIAFELQTGSSEIKDYSGLSISSPTLSFLMMLFLLSLVGIPPLAGFVGKYYLFAAAIEKHLIWLVVIAVLTSVISLYYYVGVIKEMYFNKKEGGEKIFLPFGIKLALLICIIGVLLVGLFPNPFLNLASQAATVFKY